MTEAMRIPEGHGDCLLLHAMPPSPLTITAPTGELSPSATVLLLVDFINPLAFEGAQDLTPQAIAAARSTARLKAALGKETLSIYANDNYGTWRSDFPNLWRRCAKLAGAPGRIARQLKPRRDDLSIVKPRHSAFYNTPLEILLAQLKTRRLVVTGISADNCVFFTAMDAYLRGFRLWVPANCVAAESERAKQQALEHMARVLKADVRDAVA